MSQKPSLRPAMLGAAHLNASEYSNSRHADLLNRRQQAMGNGVLFYHDPINVVRGESVWLYDDEGKKYLDCYNNVASVGHCNPEVVKALTSQASTLNTHTRYLNDNVVNYAEKLVSLLPKHLTTCVFTCTGSEAIDLAIRMAKAHTGNDGIINIESSYHGNTTLVNEVSSAAQPIASQRPKNVISVEPPNTYRGPFRNSGEKDPGKAYANLVDDAIHQLKTRDINPAAFLCDTIFDTQGVLAAPKNYFKEVKQKIHAAGGLWIADEVQAGLCRTGKWWGFEHYDVAPDIMVLGKPLGNGHPIGVLITTEEIAASFAKSNQFYFNTFAGNPVSAAVGLKVIEECERLKLVDNCRDTGAYLRAGLEKLKEKHAVIGNIRGHGLFLGVELVHDQQSLSPAADIASTLPDKMKDNGVLIGMSGRFGNVLKIRPPLVFKKEHADLFLRTFDQVLTNKDSAKTEPNISKSPKTNTQSSTRPNAQSKTASVTNQISAQTLPKVITERVIANLHKQGVNELVVSSPSVITPLAKEKARSLKMSLVINKL